MGPPAAPSPAERRGRMLADDIERRGVRDPLVLAAMGTVPRHRFVPGDLSGLAHDDRALPIGRGQTISQPYIVAAMTEAARVKPDDRVLEVGTGSGYAAAVLAEIGADVVTVERDEDLAASAASRLRDLGYDRIEVIVGDGSLGHAEGGPYDAILVAAAAPDPPVALTAQLAPGGRLVLPVGDRHGAQHLECIERRGDGLHRTLLGGVRFVPLVGEQGFDS